jgi:hypothetical protein
VAVSEQPELFLASIFTVKVPGVVKMWEGFISVDRASSSKSHISSENPTEVLVKFTVNGGQRTNESLIKKPAAVFTTFIELIVESLHPNSSITFSLPGNSLRFYMYGGCEVS